MFTQIREPDYHFSAFYKDDTILIQFILEEFIQSYQLNCQIQELLKRRLDLVESASSFSTSLLSILNQLIGHPPYLERSSFSYWAKGSLTKFKEYCEQFSRNSLYQNKQYVNLHMTVHQAWLLAMDNLELLNSFTIKPLPC